MQNRPFIAAYCWCSEREMKNTEFKRSQGEMVMSLAIVWNIKALMEWIMSRQLGVYCHRSFITSLGVTLHPARECASYILSVCRW